jgi:hypothetical protein
VGPVAFTADERRTLELAPCWVLAAVVGRYRGFDPPTVDAFETALAAASARHGLARELAVSVRARLPELLAAFEADGRPIVTGLMEVDDLLSRLPDAEAEEFRGMLVDTVGGGVARARGPFGAEATREDAERLELAAAILAPTPTFGGAYLRE